MPAATGPQMPPQRPDIGVSAVVTAVVLDIEGTTGSISHVRDVLFPYARARLAGWMRDERSAARREELMAMLRADAAIADLDETAAIALMQEWADKDVKAAPLKLLQGYLWADGYARGELTGHVYPDVPPALVQWRSRGIDRWIYSSGSVQAQRDWFAHTAFGDLSGLLSGYHDLTTAGPKQAPSSYRSIARDLDLPADQILFLSDVGAELDAAQAAGWQTVLVRRPDDLRAPVVSGHPQVTTLTDLHLEVDHRRSQER